MILWSPNPTSQTKLLSPPRISTILTIACGFCHSYGAEIVQQPKRVSPVSKRCTLRAGRFLVSVRRTRWTASIGDDAGPFGRLHRENRAGKVGAVGRC